LTKSLLKIVARDLPAPFQNPKKSAPNKKAWVGGEARADTGQQKRRDTAPQCLGADAGL